MMTLQVALVTAHPIMRFGMALVLWVQVQDLQEFLMVSFLQVKVS